MKTNLKISQFSRFLLMSGNAIKVKIWKWLKLLSSVPFIKKKNLKSCLQSNLIVLTDFHSFTVNEDKLKNSRIQYSNSVFKISAMVRISAMVSIQDFCYGPYFCYGQYSRFLLWSGYEIKIKIWKWLNFLILFQSSRKHEEIMFTIEVDQFYWL